ncbi:autotransporter assembly complex family protein [Dongia soli]|uniref:Autotransporter assembly complex family protein n=1 Tax=Dongia soli TaxID=600628 RepID=A0ABU5EDR1_9PROT|nr:autotransporter assembly complex family protein [Dongia soli]MDY0884190.1 autotransporter assembly complex family protein [Dongia soli]
MGAIFIGAIITAPHTAFALTYKTDINSLEDDTLEQAVNASSTLIELQDSPPDSLLGLFRRANEDMRRLQQALRSSGYYDGSVEIRIDGRLVSEGAPSDEAATAKSSHPVKVDIKVTPGELYRLDKISLTLKSDLPHRLKPALNAGSPARAADILAQRDRLLNAVLRQGFPFAKVELQPAVVDHARHTVSVTYMIDPGPAATMGPVTVKGLKHVNPSFIQRHVNFSPGERYSPDRLNELREELRTMDLFSAVKLTPADKLNDKGELPIEVEVTERDRRFVGFGANYSTNDGAGASVFWGHRNLFGGGERLRLQADVSGLVENDLSETNYAVSATFRKPDLLAVNQNLLSSLSLNQQYDEDTFDKKAATATVGLERRLSKTLSVTGGLEIEKSQITDHTNDSDTQDFFLFGPTGSIRRDTSNDLLNPTKGTRLEFAAAAFPEVLGSSQNVFTTRATGTGYLNLVGRGDLVLAGRLSVGNAFGGKTHDLPADRRLYAGGGGSVRGYKFRSISPRDSHGDFTGGRSAVEGSIELRYRFLGDFGVVPFLDAGTVSEEVFPAFDETIQYAAGIGLRYYTAIGPIRADFAVPLNPRSDDDKFAFYVSIGQAF